MTIEDLKYWLSSLGKSTDTQALMINDLLDNAVSDSMSKEDRESCLEALNLIGMERRTLTDKERQLIRNIFAPCHKNYNPVDLAEDANDGF